MNTRRLSLNNILHWWRQSTAPSVLPRLPRFHERRDSSVRSASRMVSIRGGLAALCLFTAGVRSPLRAEAAFDLAAVLQSATQSVSYPPGNAGARFVERAMGEAGGLLVTGRPARKKGTYASVAFRFAEPVNMSGLTSFSFYAKADVPALPKLGLVCQGGKYTTGFSRTSLSGSFKKFVFHRTDFKVNGQPDLARVQALDLGFGLWQFDTRKRGFTITVARFRYEGTEDSYVIPKPKRGVAVDGQFKDWGFEDNLYNWTPPDYVHLNDRSQAATKAPAWHGPAQLSGRFAFMLDDRNLYFLALIVDATPFQGAHVDQVWKNDSVELFLKFRPTEQQLRLGGAGPDVQMVFDCGEDTTRTRCFLRGKPAKVVVRRKTLPRSWLVAGRQTKGYVLEAAVPLAGLGVPAPERGMLIGYSLKLNDASGLSLTATPENPEPHATVRAFRRAYFQIPLVEEKSIAFGPPARDVFWPARYTRGEGRVRVWDMSRAVRKRMSQTVERLYLNTFWAVQGVESGDTSPKPGAWAYMPLPMGIGWYTPIYRPQAPSSDTLGRELSYDVLGGRKGSFFWFERMFTPPREFQAGKLRLVFEYAVEEATVYLNGRILGRVDCANTALDVTGRVKCGEANRIDVLLYCPVRPGYSVRNGWGITGDVYLEQHAHAPVIRDIWVKQASGLDGSFEIVTELGAADFHDTRLTADVLDKGQRVVAHAQSDAPAAVTALKGVCKSFRPWSPAHPNLFTLRLRFERGGKLIDERRKRFGFRTFEIKNARFLLNGRILRLRAAHATNPSHVMDPGRMRMLKRYGHNSIFLHAGDFGHNTPLFDKMDEVGLVGFAPTSRAWSNEKTVAAIRRYRSHPCVLGYVSDQFGLLSIDGFNHNPFQTSDTYYPESAEAVKLLRFLRKRYDFFHSLDPTRPYFPQATGNFEGAFRSVNHYPTFDLNLLDHAMYFVPWAKRKRPLLPFHLYECGVFALPPDITHPEHKFPVCEDFRMVKRLTSYECASRYLGTQAFDGWRGWEAMMMRASVRGFRTCGIDGFTPWTQDDMFLAPCNTTRAQDIKDNRRLSYRYFLAPFEDVFDDSWMRLNSWYYRLRGQARWPWPAKYGQGKLTPKRSMFTSVYENEMQPLFAYIGGPPRDVFAREHNFYAGERIERQIVAINDTERDADVALTVAFEVNGKSERRRFKLRVPQGGILRQPFAFTAPAGERKARATLRLTCRSAAGESCSDTFAVTVFPKHRAPDWPSLARGVRIGVVPSPDKPRLIAKVGLPARTVSLKRPLPGDLDVLLVERNALSKHIRRDQLERFVNAGGRVVVFEQTDSSALDWRLRERRLETAFIADRKHPIVTGLDDADLAYFRGPARIVPREKGPSRFYRHGQSVAIPTPHLTNEGLVASYVMQKPCYGDVHPVLVAGYDLEESALIELRSGRGAMWLCQTDVTDRYGLDPAATRLVDNLLRYVITTKPPAETAVVAYVGGPQGTAFLDRLGIAYSGERGASPVLVLGEGARLDAGLVKHRRAVVVLPFAGYLPAGVAARPVRIQKLDYPHYWNTTYYQFDLMKSPRPAPDRLGAGVGSAFRGLVDNDAYFFESPRLNSFVVSPSSEFKVEWRSEHGTMIEGHMGSTRMVLCSVNPYVMRHGECRRKAWRIWSVVFSNLGVANRFRLRLSPPALDLSGRDWTFLTDPDGVGDKVGYPRGEFGGRKPRPIRVGRVWEEQGVTERNPNIASPPDSAYDGFAWYFCRATIPASLRGEPLYLHVGGVRDIRTFNRLTNRTDLWVNGAKQPDPVGVYNAKEGGRAGRLWRLDPKVIRFGAQNLIALRVYNDQAAGGIHRKPVRLETEGQNPGMPFPYEFVRSKYTPYFFWAW